jgi:hypothetical protein
MAASPKTPKAKFVAPPKPTTAPTSLEIGDYQYTDDKGNARFYQGFDAKFKSNLMKAARDLGTNGKTRTKAIKILVANGWSTADREAAALQVEKDKADRIVARAKAKVAKAAAKDKPAAKTPAKSGGKGKGKPRRTVTPDPVVETEPEAPVVEDEPVVTEPVAVDEAPETEATEAA